MTVKERIEAMDHTFKKQKSVEDRLWYCNLLLAERNIRLRNIESGQNETDVVSEEEDRKREELNNKLFDELLGDGSAKSVLNIYRKFGAALSKVYIAYGEEYNEVLKTLPEDDPDREKKAAYIVYSSAGTGKYLASAIQPLMGIAGLTEYLNSNENARLKIWNNLNYSRELTVEAYMDALDMSLDERKAYLADNNCYPYEKLYNVVYKNEQKIRKENKDERPIKPEDIDFEIEKDYMGYFLDKIPSKGNYILDEVRVEVKNSFFGSDKKLFEMGTYIYSGQRAVDKDPDHSISIFKGNSTALAKTPEEKEKIKKEIKDFEKWIEEKGNALADRRSKEIDEKVAADFQKTIYSGKEIGFRSDGKMPGYFKDEIGNLDASFLRGVIKDLESTKTGGRKNNSVEYENMLSRLKVFERAIASNNFGAAADFKDGVIKDCLKYIEDKYKVRRKDWSNKRFEDAMLVLSEIMPKEDFKKLVNDVNRARSEKKGGKHYIDYEEKYEKSHEPGGLYSKLRLEEKAREDKLQRDTHINSTLVKPFDKDKIVRLDELFGKKVILHSALYQAAKVNLNKEPKDFFAEYKEEFVPIGPHKDDFTLSEKDFAALAYAGAASHGVTKLGDRYNGLDAVAVERGRKAAYEAMKAYAEGDKEPVAKLLAEGITFVANETKNAKSIDDAFVCNSEMVNRMRHMLHREPELQRLGVIHFGLTRENFRSIKETDIGAKLLEDYKEAGQRLNTDKNMSSMERARFVNDIVTKKTVDYIMRAQVKKGKKSGGILESLSNPEIYDAFKKDIAAFIKSENLEKASMVQLDGNIVAKSISGFVEKQQKGNTRSSMYNKALQNNAKASKNAEARKTVVKR